jgi:hypothetical protein
MLGNLTSERTHSRALQKSAEEPIVDPRAVRAWRLPLTQLTVLTSPEERAPASPMVMMSAALLHRLLATARAIGPRRAKPEPPTEEIHLDIKV